MLLAVLTVVLAVLDPIAPAQDDPTRSVPAAQASAAPQQTQPAPAGSDASAEEKKPPTPPHTGIRALATGLVADIKHLPSKENTYLTLMGGALALAAHPLDDTFNLHL